MKNLGDNYHLHCRKGVWYYRRRLPKVQAAIYGNQFAQFSLKTRNKTEAKRLRTIEDARIDALTENVDSEAISPHASIEIRKLSSEELTVRLNQYFEQKFAKSVSALLRDPPSSNEMFRDIKIDLEQGIQHLSNFDAPYLFEWVSSESEKIVAFFGKDVELSGEASTEFGERIRFGLIEYNQRMLAAHAGSNEIIFDKKIDYTNHSIPTFSEIADQYLLEAIQDAEINGRSKRWPERLKADVTLIVEIVGPSTAISSVDYDVCTMVRQKLSMMPKNRNKLYANITVDEAIKRARNDGNKVLSIETQKQYLGKLKNILKLAVNKQLVGSNPAADIAPILKSKVSANQKRPSWTLDQIEQFFTGSYYRSCADSSKDYPYSGAGPSWRFWLPLICLFMGMRPKEVCQLEPTDVMQTSDLTWYVDVTDKISDKKPVAWFRKTLKTPASRRRILIHPELIKIGFLCFVMEKKKEGTTLLFSELNPDKYGSFAKYPLARFREKFLAQDVKLNSGQVFYSLRHSFRDALRRCNASPSALQALGGWNQGVLTSDNYGDKFDPDTNRIWIEQVKFGKLDLSFLHCVCAEIDVNLNTASNKREMIGIISSETVQEGKEEAN